MPKCLKKHFHQKKYSREMLILPLVIIIFSAVMFIVFDDDNLTNYQSLRLILIIVIAVFSIFGFCTNYYSTIYRHYCHEESDIMQMEKDNIRIITFIREQTYVRLSNAEEYNTYEIIARKSLKTCNEIFKEMFYKSDLRKSFIPFFERTRSLHWEWFNDNSSTFSDEFVAYIKRAEWRRNLPLHQADRLRWIYEVDSYDKLVLSPLHPDMEGRLLSRIDSEIQKFAVSSENLATADIGCGDGKLVAHLPGNESIDQLTGIDYSPRMLNKARTKLAESKNTKNVNFVNCDMRQLSEFKNSFDVVFSINSILPKNPDDMPVMLREVASTIKKRAFY